MLTNAYLLAKIGADTAENEQHFAEILPIGRCVADRRRTPLPPAPAGPHAPGLLAARVRAARGHPAAGRGPPGLEKPRKLSHRSGFQNFRISDSGIPIQLRSRIKIRSRVASYKKTLQICLLVDLFPNIFS